MRLARFERQDFLNNYWQYEPGEHLYVCETTGQGKSYLIGQLLEQTLPELENTRYVSLLPKPRDPATSYWAPRLGLRIVDRWPPPGRWPWQDRPAGYALWPRHLKDAPVTENRAHIARILRSCMKDQYWRGNSVTLLDDAHVGAVLCGLNPDLEEILTAGGGMGSAMWVATQKPSGSQATGGITSFVYNSTTHLFLGKDKDERNIRRFSEIGGVDPDLIAGVVRDLRIHRVQTPQGVKNISEKLYIHKGGPWMCIIGP